MVYQAGDVLLHVSDRVFTRGADHTYPSPEVSHKDAYGTLTRHL